ncbi:ribonuclease E inhibitor RraB [Nocardia sp. A7]|uniref:ribonuclease E inhibitor RraB n=1 Tax=Nocardia sp. A7 TaxID=2789274 RepID=UPI00397DCA5C
MVVVRMWRRLFGGSARELDASRDDLVVVASSFDDVEACSTALDRASALDLEADAVLRHHLRLPAEQIEAACEIAGYDGYERAETTAGSDDLVAVILQRVQRLDPLTCSQERSRMAGLAQRHDGVADGWDALQPPRTAP